MNIIDPHLHLFALNQGKYHWLKDKNPPFWPDKHKINHSYDEIDIALSEGLSLQGFVHIEAGFDNEEPWQELRNLESRCQLAFRSIAGINLLDNQVTFAQSLEKSNNNSSFIGVRHILDDQVFTILKNDLAQANFTHLNNYSHQSRLIFESQLNFSDTPACELFFKLVSKQVDTLFIINHMGFPASDTTSSAWTQWYNNLTKLASLPNIAIKCSGWEMINRSYSTAWVEQCLHACLEAFTAKRVMLASNFPLCLFSQQSYQSYWQGLMDAKAIQALSTNEKSALSYDNALLCYKIPLSNDN